MKTKKELYTDILTTIMKIEELFPELSKYIDEMPDHICYSDNSTIQIKNLQDYYNSLDILLLNYVTYKAA